MTPPTSEIRRRGDPRVLSLLGILGNGVLLLISSALTTGVRARIDVTSTARWAYTDPLIAVTAIAIAGWMTAARCEPRVPLYLIIISALAVIGGGGLELYGGIHAPGSEDYLSSALQLLGWFAMFRCAAGGLVSSLISRWIRRHPS